MSHPDPGLGIWESVTGPQCSPRSVDSATRTRFGGGSVVAHEGHEGAVASPGETRLDVPAADQGGAGVPMGPVVIGDRHEGHRESVVVHPQDEPIADREGMRPGHPAEPAVEEVGGIPREGIQVLPDLPMGLFAPVLGVFGRQGFQSREGSADARLELGAGCDVEHLAAVPFGSPGGHPIGADPELEEGPLPMVVEDGRVEQPEPLGGIYVQGRVAIGITRGVGEDESRTPLVGPLGKSGGLDPDVVGLPFPRTVEPAGEEVAIRGFDEAGSVVVPGFQGEEESTLRRGLGQDGGKGHPEEEDPDHIEERTTRQGAGDVKRLGEGHGVGTWMPPIGRDLPTQETPSGAASCRDS